MRRVIQHFWRKVGGQRNTALSLLLGSLEIRSKRKGRQEGGGGESEKVSGVTKLPEDVRQYFSRNCWHFYSNRGRIMQPLE